MSEAEAATDGQSIAGALPAAVDSASTQDSTEATQPAATQDTRPNGGYAPPVDLSGLPEEYRGPLEARFAHMSKLMKKTESKYASRISERDQLLAEQSRIIEELQSGMGAVVEHLSDKSLNDAEAQAKQQLREAHQSGDTEAFISANERLAEIKAKKALQAQQKKTAKPRETKAEREHTSAVSFASEAVESGEMDSDDARAIGAWQSETDQNGNSLRPWAQSRNPANPMADPLYRRALIESAAVFDEASPWANKNVAEKLAEVDRRMGVNRTTSGQQVMGGQLTMPRKTQKIGLTAYQETLAVKTKFGGPKAKSDSDHIEAYRKQVEGYKAKKGAR